jgi:hypothetical protein
VKIEKKPALGCTSLFFREVRKSMKMIDLREEGPVNGVLR